MSLLRSRRTRWIVPVDITHGATPSRTEWLNIDAEDRAEARTIAGSEAARLWPGAFIRPLHEENLVHIGDETTAVS